MSTGGLLPRVLYGMRAPSAAQHAVAAGVRGAGCSRGSGGSWSAARGSPRSRRGRGLPGWSSSTRRAWRSRTSRWPSMPSRCCGGSRPPGSSTRGSVVYGRTVQPVLSVEPDRRARAPLRLALERRHADAGRVRRAGPRRRRHGIVPRDVEPLLVLYARLSPLRKRRSWSPGAGTPPRLRTRAAASAASCPSAATAAPRCRSPSPGRDETSAAASRAL